ncbi:DUF6197 family protein [Streptomyces calvus]
MAASLHTTPAQADQRPCPAPADALTLDARLAAVEAAMTVTLDQAAVAHEVRTAYLNTAPVDLADVVTVPLTPTPPPPPRTYPTPVAALLERARHRMEARGWCAGTAVDEAGAVCLIGAIRAEAGTEAGLAADAASVLLDAIRRRFGDHIDSVPAFNDTCSSGRSPARMLGEAAAMAEARGL